MTDTMRERYQLVMNSHIQKATEYMRSADAALNQQVADLVRARRLAEIAMGEVEEALRCAKLLATELARSSQ